METKVELRTVRSFTTITPPRSRITRFFMLLLTWFDRLGGKKHV